MRFLLHTLKAIHLVLKGIGSKSAFYFAKWNKPEMLSTYNSFVFEGNGFLFRPSGFRIPKQLLTFCYPNLDLLSEVCKDFDVRNSSTGLIGAQSPKQKSSKVYFHILGYESIMVAKEIFQQEIYGFRGLDDCVVFDVGMNVGLASLYFASCPNVSVIYGYEPFLNTFESARRNLALNADLSIKVVGQCAGWANEEGVVDVKEIIGNASVFESVASLPIVNKEVPTGSQIRVLKASKELRKIRDIHRNQPLILKLDCEGSEYEIVNDLALSNTLRMLTGVFIEWHAKGYEELVQLLSDNGFVVSYSNNQFFPESIGMIYAWNTN